MPWPAAAAALALALGLPNPDPRSLAASAEDHARADQAVALFASPKFKDRDRARRELLSMGRLALPAVEKALAATADTETRARCEVLRPILAEAKFRDQLACFLADTDAKFAHDLPAWKEFAAAAGDNPGSRALFAELLRSTNNIELLRAMAAKSPSLSDKLMQRRMELYQVVYNFTPNGAAIERKPLTVPFMAATVLAEMLAPPQTDRRYQYIPFIAMQQPAMREALLAAGDKSAAFRKLTVNWLDTRTDGFDLNYVMNIANVLNLPELPVAKVAEKILHSATPYPYAKMQAAFQLARTNDVKYIPLLEKNFTDTGVTQVFRGGNQRTEVAVRDTALVSVLLLRKLDPIKFGFESQSPTPAGQVNYLSYTLPSPEARRLAFVRYGFSKLGTK
jgi:hypothetical protein